MDYTQPGFWIAIGVGGSLVATLSTAQQFSTKSPEQPLKPNAILRDFCFGAFLTAILYMLIPESMTSWVSAGQSAVQGLVNQARAQTGGGSSALGGGDIELQTGPARF